MYVDEPPKDGNIPDFNISKIDICPFRACQRSFRLFQSDFSKDIHLRSRLPCFTQNGHTGQAEFKMCPFLKWAQLSIVVLSLPDLHVIKRAPYRMSVTDLFFISSGYFSKNLSSSIAKAFTISLWSIFALLDKDVGR